MESDCFTVSFCVEKLGFCVFLLVFQQCSSERGMLEMLTFVGFSFLSSVRELEILLFDKDTGALL
jgi:hypothetical protein